MTGLEPERARQVLHASTFRGEASGAREPIRPRVLVVDDDPHVLHGIRRLLRKRYDVTVLDSPVEAVRLLELDQDFAVIISDYDMPVMTGVDFLALAILLAPDAVRVMLTGSADPVTAVEAINVARVFRFIGKPFAAEGLRAAIEAAGDEFASAALDRQELRRIRGIHEAEAEIDAERRLDIGRAIDGGIHTVFQPIVRLDGRTIVGHEALSRFAGGSGRSPDRWFDEATALGMGIDLDVAAIRVALATWRSRAPSEQSLWLNMSPATVLSGAVCRDLIEAPHRLVIEITERTPVDDYAGLRDALAPLREGGLLLAIDDVGAGYSSLRHVTELRPDIVKIDRSIISDLDTDDHRRALVSSLIAFADASGITPLGEGVETVEEASTLADLGVGLGQGYHFGRPDAEPVGGRVESLVARRDR